MFLREFEAKHLLQSVGVTVPGGTLIRDPAELDECALSYPLAVKAQVAGGGRGKAGGVVRAEDPAAARSAVRRVLSLDFEGERAEAVLLEPWLTAERELYLCVAVDGRAGGYVVLYAPQGGVEVEAGQPPTRYDVGPPNDFRGHELRDVLAAVEPDAALRESVVPLARQLLHLAASRDCVTIEINPLFVVEDGGLVAGDAKVILDEWAAFRSADIAEAIARARRGEPDLVRRCLEADLMLVPLDGDIGLISGGAGMTMAVMDLIAEAGGRPACFLDCSANPAPRGYGLAFAMLDADPQVRSILVSIFGGATQMERVARVMTRVMAERDSDKPVVFRLNGTNAHQIEDIFAAAGLDNHATIEAAVASAVNVIGGGA